jgi:predicted MPP superfamily phosphohydrolase
MTKRQKRFIRLGIILAVLAALGVWALYSGLVVRHYEVGTDKLDSGETIRIVVIADLHSHVYGDDQQPLIDKIAAQQPDVIALAGDIVDDDEPVAGAKLFLHAAVDIAPVYYVTGNHEYWSGACDAIKKMIAGYGIRVLSNESETMRIGGTDVCLCGIDDPEVMLYTDDPEILRLASGNDLLRRFSDLDGNAVNVLLAHRPERTQAYQLYDFDVVLSGHAHGGQVRLPPILNGLFAPDQGWFPKYGGGMYVFDNQTMIVSRGLSFNRYVPRVFNPPEVVVVDIVGE